VPATMTEFADVVIGFVQRHEYAAGPIVFALAFAESLAFVSLIFPATLILWGVGALIGAGGLEFWPIWAAAAFGAGLGDWLSYGLGAHFRETIGRMWPLSQYPNLLPQGRAFFVKWGLFGVFISKFFGPLRAAVPLAAGIAQMPALPFQIANWASAVTWSLLTLAPGAFGLPHLARWIG
jgi:membrane protein DedA with SNARE-associated domain